MILNFIRTHIRSIIILLFFVVTSIIIIYLLPHEGKFMFEYQKGGFWKHESLTAPFNFPVNKTKAEIDRERDSVMHEFKPIFVFDNITGLNIPWRFLRFHPAMNIKRTGNML
jgi:hypothetical protein